MRHSHYAVKAIERLSRPRRRKAHPDHEHRNEDESERAIRCPVIALLCPFLQSPPQCISCTHDGQSCHLCDRLPSPLIAYCKGCISLCSSAHTSSNHTSMQEACIQRQGSNRGDVRTINDSGSASGPFCTTLPGSKPNQEESAWLPPFRAFSLLWRACPNNCILFLNCFCHVFSLATSICIGTGSVGRMR